MSDLISRQAAIDRIQGTGYADAIKNNLMVILRLLPSVQPEVLAHGEGELSAQTEIIQCKDCKHRPTRDEDGWLDFPTERCPCQCDDFYYSWMPKDDWFCGNAERREE